MMNYRTFSSGSVALALLFASLTTLTAEDVKDGGHAGHMKKCAQVCAACQVECDACFHHCATLVTEGKKDHAKCMHLCVDCAACCQMCAALCARQSDLSAHAAECCAKCCDDCAAACEKFPNDKHMAECAKSCRDCAKECRAMLKMMTK